MSILSQKTISKNISVKGVGVHTGVEVNLEIFSSEPNTGIIFKRTDLKNNNVVIPNFKNVTDTPLCTTISNEYGVKVSNIEHLMGAFYGLGIDNAIVAIIIIINFFLLKFLMKSIQIIIKYIDIINIPVLLPVNINAPTASILTIYE